MATIFPGTGSLDVLINGFSIVQLLGGDPARARDPSFFNQINGTAIPGSLYVTTFQDNGVTYATSPAAVIVDLARHDANVGAQGDHLFVARAHGGHAEGDLLVALQTVTGSAFDDVIRGQGTSVYVPFVLARDAAFVPPFGTFTGAFRIDRNPGDNIFHGGGGNDVLEGRAGADTLDGGPDFDLASFESSPSAVTVRLPGAGQTARLSGGDAVGDHLQSIEGLIGSAFADTLTGNSGINRFVGGRGDDTIDGKGGFDTVDYSADIADRIGLFGGQVFVGQVSGSPDTDHLVNIERVIGTVHDDDFFGGAGADTFLGGDGDETMDGGRGNDTLDGQTGHNLLLVDGSDTLRLGPGETLTLTLGDGDGDAGGTMVRRSGIAVLESDTLFHFQDVQGSRNGETIIGNAADNLLDGFAGHDTIDGKGGFDLVAFSIADPVTVDLRGANDQDSAVQGGVTSTLTNIEGAIGTFAADTFFGDGNANRFDGQLGVDTFTGASGNDRYVYTRVTDSGTGAGNRDLIKDFAPGQDDLDFSSNAAFDHFVGNTALAHAGDVRIRFVGTDKTLVEATFDNNATADFQIELTGHKTLTAGDFIFG